jgi:hypothetical protein
MYIRVDLRDMTTTWATYEALWLFYPIKWSKEGYCKYLKNDVIHTKRKVAIL